MADPPGGLTIPETRMVPYGFGRLYDGKGCLQVCRVTLKRTTLGYRRGSIRTGGRMAGGTPGGA